MRLGAFLQYKKYMASRHQRVGRSTCRVHPCKQENMVKAVPVLTHTHTHTRLSTNRRAIAKSECASPRLVMKQDKACSRPIGAFQREQAHRGVHVTYKGGKARLCTLAEPALHPTMPQGSAAN